MKQVQIVVPLDKTETVYDFLLDVLDVKNVMKFNADNAYLFQFRVSDGVVSETMEKLKSRGVGVEYGFIDILDLKASLPRDSEEEKESRIQREATLAVEEIYENVKGGTAISFDFIAFVILAAVIAGIGLIQNNATVIVASMLLSPLMGPMLGVALGYVVRDRDLFFKGTINELFALCLSFFMGAIIGTMLVFIEPTFLADVETAWVGGIPTEVTRRGILFSFWDVGIAIFSGAAVAVSVTRGDMSSLVGVAISAALMPPAVNVGMMTTLGIIGSSAHALAIAGGSIGLLAMNIVLIDLAAIVMFRIKKLTPMADKSATWKAVTDFRAARSGSLYHAAVPDAVPQKQTPAATFTPVTETPEPPEEKVSPEDSADSSKTGQ